MLLQDDKGIEIIKLLMFLLQGKRTKNSRLDKNGEFILKALELTPRLSPTFVQTIDLF
ncbi:hypothetical protein [Riemerella anatipestifer]|uniref:hypothetical protein n=1 Tax=Riemerella anatipestifer TaxID=34085 RepID=UPI0021F81A3C|nr:hypothetical protein [Riemerella anatipestifer]MCW0489431.1 hypothetical protein [Riemerella anatipestifer]